MKRILILTIAILLLLSACKPTKQHEEILVNTPPAEAYTFTAENMPIIDGSTATIPLIEAVYSVLLGIPVQMLRKW